MSSEFDKYADDYRTIHTENVSRISGKDSAYFCEYKIIEIKNRDLIKDDARFLDYGCGDGSTSKYLKKHYPNSIYSGIDISEDSINIAKEVYGNNGDFHAYDGKTICFDDNTFDVVFMACVMHHIPLEYRENTVKECLRVLKPGGKIIIFEHNPYNPVTLKVVNTCQFDENAILISARRLRELFKKFNEKIKIRYTIFLPRKGIFKHLLFLEKILFPIPLGGQYYAVIEKI